MFSMFSYSNASDRVGGNACIGAETRARLNTGERLAHPKNVRRGKDACEAKPEFTDRGPKETCEKKPTCNAIPSGDSRKTKNRRAAGTPEKYKTPQRGM